MDLVLNADMDFTQSITLLARPVSLIALIVLITIHVLIALQDLVLTVLTIVGHAMFLTVSYVNLQISALLASLPITLIIPQTPAIVCILISYWQTILVSVLLEEVVYLEIIVDAAMLIAPSVMQIQEFAHHAMKVTD